MGYIGSLPGCGPSRDSDSWNTPTRYLDAARRALGGAIDLDPYTSLAANVRVGAALTFTAAEPAPPGTQWPLVDTVWMNPPYSGALVLQASSQLVAAYQAKRFQRAVVLVNNATDTRFFNLLLREAAAVCFTEGRIAFENVDGKRISGNTRGQAFFWFGKDCQAFADEFARFGPVMRCGKSLLGAR
jgi:hypothetical protein